MFRDWMRNRLGLNAPNQMNPMGGMKTPDVFTPQPNPMSPMGGGGYKNPGSWIPQENPINPIVNPVDFQPRPRGGDQPFQSPHMVEGMGPQPTQVDQGRNRMALYPYMW